jgi:hypothetical protein
MFRSHVRCSFDLCCNIARAMITRDCKRSTTSSNCVIFAFPMESMSPTRALTSEQIAPRARPMTVRACTPLAQSFLSSVVWDTENFQRPPQLVASWAVVQARSCPLHRHILKSEKRRVVLLIQVSSVPSHAFTRSRSRDGQSSPTRVDARVPL